MRGRRESGGEDGREAEEREGVSTLCSSHWTRISTLLLCCYMHPSSWVQRK